MSKIEIRLFQRTGGDKKEYHVGNYGDAPCTIDLSRYTILCFSNRNNPDDKTIVLREKKEKE